MISFNRYIIFILGIPLVVALVSLLSISIVLSSSREYIYHEVSLAPKTDAALILGAAVLKNGGLSPVLRDRVDEAIDLYRAQKVTRIIASGNSTIAGFDEVEPVLRYLLEAGIPKDVIELDRAGFDTYSSIYRARDVFEVTSLTIVSQSFHLPRAVFIARELGIEAFGVSADRGRYKMANYFREMAADVKAVANLITERTPHSLQKELATDLEEGAQTPRFIIPLW